MNIHKGQLFPEARREDLVVQELSDEVLVYDRKLDKAHCLNQTAASVWKYCDGKTRIEDIHRQLEIEFNTPADEQLVWLALDHLGKARLLKEVFAPPEQRSGLSRRELIRRVGLSAASRFLWCRASSHQKQQRQQLYWVPARAAVQVLSARVEFATLIPSVLRRQDRLAFEPSFPYFSSTQIERPAA